MTVYNQIGSNRTRTWVMVILFSIFAVAVATVISLGMGLPLEQAPWVSGFAVVVAGLGCLFSYYRSDSIVLGVAQAREATHDEQRDLYHTVENLCIGVGLPMPKVYVIEDSAPNAFTTGRDPQHASIAVTTGLLGKLDKLELEGVIAHELSHIRNYDIHLMSMVVVLVGLVSLLCDFFLRWTRYGSGQRPSNQERGGRLALVLVLLAIAIVMAILAPIAAQLIRLAISRRREFLADASGALLTRYPEGLARALEKISEDTEPLEAATKSPAHLHIVNPLKEHASILNNLFSTHPPVEERIAALRAM